MDDGIPEGLARALDELLRMNKQFMLIGLTTYVRMVKEMGPHLPSDEALVHELEVLDAVAGD